MRVHLRTTIPDVTLRYPTGQVQGIGAKGHRQGDFLLGARGILVSGKVQVERIEPTETPDAKELPEGGIACRRARDHRAIVGTRGLCKRHSASVRTDILVNRSRIDQI